MLSYPVVLKTIHGYAYVAKFGVSLENKNVDLMANSSFIKTPYIITQVKSILSP